MIWAPRYPPRPAVGRLRRKRYVSIAFPIPLWICWSIPKTAKRFFRVIAKGVAVVNRAHRALESMTEGLGFIRSYS